MRQLFRQYPDNTQTILVAQSQIDENDVRLRRPHLHERVVIPTGRCHDLQICLLVDHGFDAIAQDAVILYEQDPDLLHRMVSINRVGVVARIEDTTIQQRYGDSRKRQGVRQMATVPGDGEGLLCACRSRMCRESGAERFEHYAHTARRNSPPERAHCTPYPFSEA